MPFQLSRRATTSFRNSSLRTTFQAIGGGRWTSRTRTSRSRATSRRRFTTTTLRVSRTWSPSSTPPTPKALASPATSASRTAGSRTSRALVRLASCEARLPLLEERVHALAKILAPRGLRLELRLELELLVQARERRALE